MPQQPTPKVSKTPATLPRCLLSATLIALLVSTACKPLVRTCSSCAEASHQTSADTAAWRAALPSPGRPGRLSYPIHEDTSLPNGLRVLSLNRPAGVVSLSLIVRLPPSKLETSGENALLARMLTEGTKALPGLTFAEAVENLGTQIYSGADRDSAYLSITVLPEDTEAAMNLLFDAAANPEFAPEPLERVRAEWLAGLKARCDDPSQLAALVGLRALWGDTHGAPVQGTPASVRRISSNDLTALHTARFVPGSAALVAVGQIGRDELLKLATTASSTWKAAPSMVVETPPPPAPPGGTQVLVVERKGAVQTALFVAQPMPARNAPGHEVRLVANTALGGLFTSRINQNLREQHAYTYGASSSILSTRFAGAWMAITNVEAQYAVAALRELLKERAALGDGTGSRPLSSVEVDRARAALVARVGAHLQSADTIADDLGDVFLYDLDRRYYAGFGQLLSGIDSGMVETAAKESFTTPPPVIVAVGDADELLPALERAEFSTKRADTGWLEMTE